MPRAACSPLRNERDSPHARIQLKFRKSKSIHHSKKTSSDRMTARTCVHAQKQTNLERTHPAPGKRPQASSSQAHRKLIASSSQAHRKLIASSSQAQGNGTKRPAKRKKQAGKANSDRAQRTRITTPRSCTRRYRRRGHNTPDADRNTCRPEDRRCTGSWRCRKRYVF